MFAGGEFYDDQRWALETPSISTEGMYFLNGGRACLIVISDYLRARGIGRVLLPSYLCPSIVQTLERCGMDWEYYRIQEDLSIDLPDLAEKASHHQAIYLINYFGFLHPPVVRAYLKRLQQNGQVIIEDNAQAGFPNHPSGDFIFNSLRKLAPHDGGYLITRQDMTPYLNAYRERPNQRLPLIRAYRAGLARYLFTGQGSHSQLEELFKRAEQYYETDLTVLGDPHEREQIERLDWAGIRQARRENYQYLLSLISEIPQVSPIFPVLQADNMPMGLPLYVRGVSRDRVNQRLGSAGIGLSIHWEDIAHDPRTNGNLLAVAMSSRMLTLVIDQRTSHKQMDYLAMNLMEAIQAEQNAAGQNPG